MIITIASPDKLSIKMFLSFMRKKLGNHYLIGELHSLMSQESFRLYVNDIKSKSGDLLLSYYAWRNNNKCPLDVIPSVLIDISNLVIWMGLYAVDWKVIKDISNIAPNYNKQWKLNMDKLSVNMEGL